MTIIIGSLIVGFIFTIIISYQIGFYNGAINVLKRQGLKSQEITKFLRKM